MKNPELYSVSLTKMNFNFISWIILSSILAALGLVGDDNVTLIASMIISPLMGPLVALAFGAVTSNQKILREDDSGGWNLL